jgi:flagellar biosynthetic protein FliR
MACVLSLAVARGVTPPVAMPATLGQLTVAMGGEIAFGLAMGMILSFVFIAAQWAGELVGQQMGLNLGETFDPQFGAQSSVVGDMYFMLTLVVFLVINGHRSMLMGVRNSFEALPLLTVSVDPSLLDILLRLFQGATALAFQLAAPTLVTMLVVDLALGFVGKTMPQLNVMTAGIGLRAMIGMFVLIIGIGLTNQVIREAMKSTMQTVYFEYSKT